MIGAVILLIISSKMCFLNKQEDYVLSSSDAGSNVNFATVAVEGEAVKDTAVSTESVVSRAELVCLRTDH